MPEVTTPPGELMYMAISFLGLSASRKSSCMQIEAATSSLIGLDRKMMRSFSRREGRLHCSQPRLVCSTTTGQNVLVAGGIELSIVVPGVAARLQSERLACTATGSRRVMICCHGRGDGRCGRDRDHGGGRRRDRVHGRGRGDAP